MEGTGSHSSDRVGGFALAKEAAPPQFWPIANQQDCRSPLMDLSILQGKLKI